MLKILLILSVVDFFAFVKTYITGQVTWEDCYSLVATDRSKLENTVSLKKEKTNIVILQHT